MIPISLTLKGIYSYREEQRIDFTRLTEANIFGIFGAVGSGKSTILEAISFALYGETERLHQRDNRNYNMMNLKSDGLLIDFIFRGGEDDSEYRFVAKGKRNSKNFEKVGTFDRNAYRKVAAEWVPIGLDSIESIIGLSYNNFRRTIIIPQNQFQEFLQLGDKDRTEMMKQLFHLEKYELDRQVKVLEDRNDGDLAIFKDRMKQISPVTIEQIAAAEAELKNIKARLLDVAKALKEKQNEEQEFKNLKDLFERVATQQQNVKTLELNEPDIKKLEAQLKEYEYCLFNFKNDLDNLHTLQQSIGKQDIEIKTQQQKLEDVQKQLSGNEAGFKPIKSAYDNREQLKAKIEEFSKVISIKKLEADEARLAERIKNGNETIKSVQDKIKALTEEQKVKKEALTKLKKQAADIVMLSAVRNWFTIKNGIQNNLLGLKKDLQEQEQDIKSAGDKLHKLINPAIKKITGTIPADATAAEMIAITDQTRQALGKEILEVENRVDHLNAQKKLEEYASALKAGEPCPICGSTEHPIMLDITDVKAALQSAQDARAQCQEKITVLNGLTLKLTTTGTELDNFVKALEKLKTKLVAEDAILKKHLEKFSWKGFDSNNEDDVTKAFTAADSDKKQMDVLDEAIINLNVSIDEENARYKKYEEGLKTFREDMVRISSTTGTLKSQLRISDIADFKEKAERDLQNEINALDKEYVLIETEYQRFDKLIAGLKAKENQLKGGIETGLRGLEAAKKSSSEIEIQFNKKLKSSAYGSLQKIELILKSDFNIELERGKINTHQLQLHSAREQYKLLHEQTTGKIYDEQRHLSLTNVILELQQKNEHLIANRENFTKEIALLKIDMDTLQQLQLKIDELNLRKDDITTLKQLFKAGGFVNYVSSVYLQNLCNAANDRFYQLTRHKLKLELNSNNNFEIRDFMNNGQVRSVKTLSGGQTFQAALSLALALADNIQKLTNSNQNFFFLDEGFGSLDKESLQIVFDTLQSLRKENRIVGVISHVEEMQQEIDTWLKIVNEEERGSIVEASWEN